MSRLFGTDGMRGRAGEEPLTAGTLQRLGRVLARQLREQEAAAPPAVVIGHDGRESGETLVAALADGLSHGGVRVDVVGLAPTPTVAFLTASGEHAAGIVVSASHNPAEDNGVKLLGSDGMKLADEVEESLEQALLDESLELGAVAEKAEVKRTKGMVSDYIAWLRNEAFPELDLAGRRVLMDCANGAYSELAPRILRAFGAEAELISHRPDGHNINRDCGALHPEQAARAIVEHGCELGLTVDGDGDRGLVLDRKGRVLDGDALLAGLGAHLAEHDALPQRCVVATVMSNMALNRHFDRLGLELERVAVGDRNVMAAMRTRELGLGGEKSGHILFGAEHGYRGDGMYTFLRVAEAIRTDGLLSTDFARDYSDYPQKLVNLAVQRRVPLTQLEKLTAAQAAVEDELGSAGRTVVRFSGTELLLRVMVEAETEAAVESAVRRLSEAANEEGILV